MKNASVIINHPKFKEWVRNFDFNDPKFCEEVDRRIKNSETYIRRLEKAQKLAERKSDMMRWVPIRRRIKD